MESLIDIHKSTDKEIEEALINRENIKTDGKHPGVITALNLIFGNNFGKYMGYTVETSKRKIVCIIFDESCCCENWDVEYKKESIPLLRMAGIAITLKVDDVDGDYDEGSAVILEVVQADAIHTIKLWNQHNGYYAHDYIIYDTSGELTTSGLI